MSILVSAGFDADGWATWWPLLHAALPEETLVRDRADAGPDGIDIAIVANPPPGSLTGLPSLRLIQSLWAGVEGLLADPTVPAQVPLARMVDPAMSEAMAQTALWAVLSILREHFDYAAQQREHRWRQRPYRRAEDVTVAVLGLGRMGRAAAQRIASLGCRVFGWSRGTVSVPIEGVRCHAGEAALPVVLAQAEVVINLLPLTPTTVGLFDAARLAMLPRGASLVNLARGAHVVEADLLAALDRGHLKRAVLDAFATEPLPPAHPFWSHPAVTVLPHVAAPTDPRSAAPIAARNVRALRAGRALEHLVDRRRGY
jgi:glyoxylate/hydroxypyruvate reductase A